MGDDEGEPGIWPWNRGWSGDANYGLRDLPGGAHHFPGVDCNGYDSATSPVPTAIKLGGPRAPGHLAAQVRGMTGRMDTMGAELLSPWTQV